jgi:hypothetical protein
VKKRIFSEISSKSDKEPVLLGNNASKSRCVRTTTSGVHDLKSKSPSASDRSNSGSDNTVYNVGYVTAAVWVVNGNKMNRFSPKYHVGTKGEMKDYKNPKDVYKHFSDNKICMFTVQQTSI